MKLETILCYKIIQKSKIQSVDIANKKRKETQLTRVEEFMIHKKKYLKVFLEKKILKQ